MNCLESTTCLSADHQRCPELWLLRVGWHQDQTSCLLLLSEPELLTQVLLLALGLLCIAWPAATADEPPAPNPDRIQYAAPDSYRPLNARLGDSKAIQGLAAQLVKKDAAATLRAIWLWARRNLRPTDTATPVWRSVSEMIRVGTRTGEAEAAIAIGTLARAASIPTVWVKTVGVDWLKAGADMASLKERTYLELHLDGAWRLLDPVTMRLFDRYDTKARLLPGDRLVFDKGGDPYALVLPNRSALYRAQVAKHFKGFDVRRLPWGVSRDLLAPIKIFIAGTAPVTRYVSATADAMGFLVAETFTAKEFARVWPSVQGRILVVTTSGNAPSIPKAQWGAVLPEGYAQVLKGTKPEKGYLTRTLANGTTVIFTAARDYASVEVAIARALSQVGQR